MNEEEIEIKIVDEIQLLKNHIQLMPKSYRHDTPNWKVVQDLLLFGNDKCGSATSYTLCSQLEIDPDAHNFKTIHRDKWREDEELHRNDEAWNKVKVMIKETKK